LLLCSCLKDPRTYSVWIVRPSVCPSAHLFVIPSRFVKILIFVELKVIATFTPLVNLLMNHIPMVTNAPGSGWGQEIELCSNLQNISFSRDRKVDDVQTCTINVSLDGRHPNGNSSYTPRDGVVSRNRPMF